MTRSRRTRHIRPRTLGWDGHWWEERQWSPWVYYPVRGYVRALRKHPWITVSATVLVLLWSMGGQAGLILAVLIVCLLAAGRLGWLGTIAGGDRGRTGLEDLKRISTLKKQWDIACESCHLLGTRTGEPPRLGRVVGDGHGTLTASVRCGPLGIPVSDFIKQADRLGQVIGCREVVVTETATGVARLTFHFLDPIGRDLPLVALPLAPEGRLAYGVRQDGSPATIIPTQSVLIGGLTRMGKSNFVWALLADALRQGMYVDLYVSDPKGGVELDRLESALGRPAGASLLRVRQYAKNTAETIEMCNAAEKAMHVRQRWMKENGTRKILPTKENPLVVIILDETLPLTDLLKKGTDSSLGRIAYTGAAAGYVVWANTQVAQIDSLGRFRDLIPQRVCFGTNSPQVTDAVLGSGAESMGAQCSAISKPGEGFSYAEGDKSFRRFKAAMITDAETEHIADGNLPPKVVNSVMQMRDRAVEASSNAGRSRKHQRTALYRWFYIDHPEYGDSLGYVGISWDVIIRESQHSGALREFLEGNVRRETVWYENRAEAEAAEKLAIQTEKPIHNIAHNGNNPRRKIIRRKTLV